MSNLGAFSMWDLFRGEVESQMRAFTDGLLALESGGSAKEHLAATMRAAHSIKGAARIVHLDVAVQLVARDGGLPRRRAGRRAHARTRGHRRPAQRRRSARAAFHAGGIGGSGVGGGAEPRRSMQLLSQLADVRAGKFVAPAPAGS